MSGDMSAWPLVLGHADAARVARGATRLIGSRTVRPGVYAVHDRLIVGRNRRYHAAGHDHLTADPAVATVRVEASTEITLAALDLRTVRAAGWQTQRDFCDERYRRHGWLEISDVLCVAELVHVSPVRMLDRRLHRGYTTDPAKAASGEPSALSASELDELARAAHRRFEREHAGEIARRRELSLRARWRAAVNMGDETAAVLLTRQLAQLKRDQEAA